MALLSLLYSLSLLSGELAHAYNGYWFDPVSVGSFPLASPPDLAAACLVPGRVLQPSMPTYCYFYKCKSDGSYRV